MRDPAARLAGMSVIDPRSSIALNHRRVVESDRPIQTAAGPSLAATALAILFGTVLALAMTRLPPTGGTLAVLLVALLLALIGSTPWLRLPALVAIGFALAALHGSAAVSGRIPPELVGIDLAVEVRIEGLPRMRPDLLRFDAVVVAGEGDGATLIGRRLRLSWYGQAPDLAAGEHWAFTVRVRRPRGVANPGGFDFERWAARLAIAGTGHVRDTGSARRLARHASLDGWRMRMSERIGQHLPEREARFVQALALGDTRSLDDEDWRILRATGLSHLLAISGFHVGVVAGFGALLARALWWLWPALALRLPRPVAAAATAMVFALAYAAAAGFALPTVRATLMIAAVLVAQVLRRARRSTQGLALALLVALVLDPLAVLGAGFWLSFMGVAWLIACLPDADRSWLRQLVQAQTVATLGLLPITVWFFGEASLIGPLLNLLAIPWVTLLVVPLALIGLAALTLGLPGADLAVALAADAMALAWRLASTAAEWPLAAIWLPEPGAVTVLAALLAATWLLLPRGLPGKLPAAILLAPLFWPSSETVPDGAVRVNLIDVGQGLSILIRTREHAMLYDAGAAFDGGLDLGEAAVVPALRALGVRQLDRLLLSHADNDHAGGASAVRAAYRSVEVLAPDGSGLDADVCRAGTGWTWNRVRFRLLHPPKHFPYLGNESSCVLQIDAEGGRLLAVGDIGALIERRLVREQNEALSADVLIVPHHGSRHSSSDAFLAAVAPRLALVSAGHGNRFGHPHPDTLARLDRIGAVVAATAESGMIAFTLDRNGHGPLEQWRIGHRRFWHEGDDSVVP